MGPSKSEYVAAIERLLKALDDQCFPVGVKPNVMRCDYSLAVDEAIRGARSLLPQRKQKAVSKRNLARVVD